MVKNLDSEASASKARSNNPFTPMRRFFFKLELLKPIVALGKRVRDQSHVADISEHLPEKKSSQAIGDPPIGSSSFIATTEPGTAAAAFIKDRVGQQNRERTAQIALQQHDQPLDAIVITTLPSYPFCCHEDLLMMSHSQLVEVAMLLNSRLPAFSQIEHADGIPDAHIRHSIETLVGIAPNMPGAPKAIKSRPFEWMDTREPDLLADPEQDTLPSPPTSPLSMRVSRRQEKALPVMTSPPHLLERLEEEDESDFFTMKRPPKKRKVSRSTVVPVSDTSVLDEDIDMEEGTPTRARDLRLPLSVESPPTLSTNMGLASSHMVLRSHSQRGIVQSSQSPISSPDVFNVDSAFVNSKPRYRSSSKNSARKSGRPKTGGSQPSSSRKTNKTKTTNLEKKTTMRTLNYRPFELPASNSDRYYTKKPLSSTSTKSSASSDEKVAIIIASFEDDKNNGISPVEHEDNQVAGGIENLTVGCAENQMDTSDV